MMNCLSRLRKKVNYNSVSWHESKTLCGVRFAVRRVSLEQRLKLTRRARELAAGNDFLRAGNAEHQLDAAVADLMVKQLYLEWGLYAISGLAIDGKPANVRVVIDSGPESLTEEILEALRNELGLTDDERKNF